MKLASLLLVGAALATVHAADSASGSGSAPAATTKKPATKKPAAATSEAASGSGSAAPGKVKPEGPAKGEWHMKPITAVHARVQGDAPKFMGSQFVSSFGKDEESGYRAAMDSVNTASVEGALLYVQAEGIDVTKRSAEDRCWRKNNMKNIVFYQVTIAQTNETIAEYSDSWNAPEYGPFVAMDGGACTATEGSEVPVECLQFNGEEGQPNLGPFVGGGIKDDDPRAPYPEAYWFSFPNTCPKETWKNKSDECRASTRTGLCPLGEKPDGVSCTFSYEILGWVTIDDVVGIPQLGDYQNFTEWCEADEANIEFASDENSDFKEGLDFWKDPLDKEANANRTQVMLDTYAALVGGDFESKQIDAKTVKNFKALPTPEELAAENPPCYESVPSCATGCRREGYSQLCRKCSEGDEGCQVAPADFAFPELAKAVRTAPETEESASASGSVGSGSVDTTIESPEVPAGSGSKSESKTPAATPAPSAAAPAHVAVAAVAATVIAALAM